MEWKVEIQQKLIQATNQRKIGTELKKLAKLLLNGDTRFILVYSSSRDTYFTILFKEKMSILTAQLLLKNGYKQFYLNNK